MNYSFWFVVGSQFLYGPEVLETVAARAQEMAGELSKALPFPLVYKVTAKTNKEIADVVKEANYDNACAGIITWCHTFSPSKMWINGLASLQKPWCHFATQYNQAIPNRRPPAGSPEGHRRLLEGRGGPEAHRQLDEGRRGRGRVQGNEGHALRGQYA